MRTIGTAEIAQMMGYSQRHVTERITKRPDFPKPVIALSRKNVKWDEADVVRWVARITQAA